MKIKSGLRWRSNNASRGLQQIMFVCFSLLFVAPAFSQTSSAYSRYGLGTLSSEVFGANKGMGGLAAAYQSSVNINAANPASYASLVNTTIEIGANVEGVSIHARDSVYKSSGGNINHFAIAFVPRLKHNNGQGYAISMGMLPFSTVKYSFAQNYNDSTFGAHTEQFSGQGSTYQIYIGGAYKYKGFSIGANVSYVFGKLEYSKTIAFPDSVGAYNSRNKTALNLSGVNYNIGVQYHGLIKKSNDLGKAIYVTAGAYGGGGVKMRASVSNYWDRYSIDESTVTTLVADTLQSSFGQKGKITLPVSAGAGLMFGNELFWTLGLDFRYSNWSTFKTPLDNGGLNDSWRLGVGAQITPKWDDRNYLKRMQYRVGGYYGKSEINFQGNNLNESGGTAGLSFPFKFVKFTNAMINVTGEFGSRGGTDKTVIRENYYRFTFGFVLNDNGWFFKRKFD